MATEPQDTTTAADPEVAAVVSPEAVVPKAEATTEDEAHRKFREALERKNHQHHASHESAVGRGGVGPSNNSKTTRQFRRKSGG